VLQEREASVWYLGHSGWAVRTKNHLLVFDYAPFVPPCDEPSLANGHINHEEIAGARVDVFASHAHGDHYSPAVFDWRDQVKKITYVFGFRPDSASGYEFVGPRDTRKIDGMKVSAIESNDSGAGFLVEVDGVTILHPGDHANRRRDFSGPYKAEIDWLAGLGVRPDIAFLPIAGCGFGDQEAVRLGVEYALETLEPAVFFPMHGGTNSGRYRDFISQCEDRFPKTRMIAVENRGDHYLYKKGKIS